MTKETGDYKPEVLHVAETAKPAERRIRARIRQAFSPHCHPVQTKTLEDQLLRLIEDYFAAPENKREEV